MNSKLRIPLCWKGKQELCATHLRSIAQAMAAYAQDNDGRFPPLDYQNAKGERVTWVSLMSGRVQTNDLTCPVGPHLPAGQERFVSSYALNPVLATAKAAELDNVVGALMLADGGGKHDVSLLPPYPTWPSFATRRPGGDVEATECNLDFRHSGKAVLAYVDGHVSAVSPGGWEDDAFYWGGSAVVRRSRTRLSERSPQTRELFKRLQADDVKSAASYLSAHRAALLPVSQEFAALWRLNSGDYTSSSVDELGWHLARAWKQAGDTSFEQQLGDEQTRRCQAERDRIGYHKWEGRALSGQPTMCYEAPAVWSSQEERDGRYRRAYVRSGLSSVYMVVEVGERRSYVTPQPIDWRGQEQDLLRRYGKGGYRRLALSNGTLGGSTASVWEYEVEKPGGPRLRKRCVGYTDGWISYVSACTAPAKDWALWKPTFDNHLGSVRTGYLSSGE